MKLLKEPLVHFLLLGGFLFLLYGWVGDDERAPDEIVVTQAKIDHLIEIWMRTRQRPPTTQELKGLIDDYVIEEILYREAKALNLDEDDTIIRRRLRQKMEFIAEDLAAIKEPTEEDLRAYLESNPDQFRLDASISFEHIFYNEDKRGESVASDAAADLDALKTGMVGDVSALGDGIPLPYQFEASSTREIASMFGPDFANELLTLPVDEWTGPVPSGYGLHLVRITDLQAGRDPELDEVRAFVEREWSAERRQQVKENFYDSFLERYTVTIEEYDDET